MKNVIINIVYSRLNMVYCIDREFVCNLSDGVLSLLKENLKACMITIWFNPCGKNAFHNNFTNFVLSERSILYTQLAWLKLCESGKNIHSVSVSEGSGEFQLDFKLLFKVQADLYSYDTLLGKCFVSTLKRVMDIRFSLLCHFKEWADQ